MGGTITALTAIDSRLRAVVPFFGGTGRFHPDLHGVAGSSGSRRAARQKPRRWPWVVGALGIKSGYSMPVVSAVTLLTGLLAGLANGGIIMCTLDTAKY